MIREIQTFLSICEYGTFANAAEQLHLTQSAVSAQIKNLEKQLGFALFNRNRRGAVLSEAGERALPLAKQIIQLFDEMTQFGENHHSGSLKLGIQQNLQSIITPALLPHLPPSTQTKFMDNIKLLDDIHQQKQHIAIVVQPDAALPNDWVVTPLFHDECLCIAPQNAEGDYAHLLATLPILAYDTTAFGNHALSAFLKQHRTGSPFLSSSDSATLIDLVAQNMGVTVLPKSSLKNMDLAHVTVLPVPLSREIVVVSLPNFMIQNQSITVIWQHNTAHQSATAKLPRTWQHTHEVKEIFDLPNRTLTQYYRY